MKPACNASLHSLEQLLTRDCRVAALEDGSTWAREDVNLCLDHMVGLLNQHLRKDVTDVR